MAAREPVRPRRIAVFSILATTGSSSSISEAADARCRMASLQVILRPHLVADIEALRRHLNVRRWILFGGSWGSTLALAYGVRWPEHCAGFVLRGIFLGTQEEVSWFLYGMGTFFPEAWRNFAEALPESERSDLLANYYRRLTDPDPAIHAGGAAWSRYETVCSTLFRVRKNRRRFSADAAALALAGSRRTTSSTTCSSKTASC